MLKKVQRVYEQRKISEVLSVEEATRVLDAAGSLKWIYGQGSC